MQLADYQFLQKKLGLRLQVILLFMHIL